ncbi:TPA: hypothetical protein EYP75_02570, partial [Candidatus Bathyarchaeota archaeon]|nr:hypothetical protein [Candidatus Bathyarchaeota archaeon]
MSDSEKVPEELEKVIGATFAGWVPETPFYSITTGHPSARILSRSVAETVYPHRNFWGYMKFNLKDAFVITDLGFKGDPDFFISREAKVAVFATDVFDDLLHYIHHPEYSRYEENLFYLTVNIIRYLLGLSFIVDPVSKDLKRWGSFFRAYAAGRQFVLSTYEELKKKVAREEIVKGLEEADQNLLAASRSALEGDLDGTWKKYHEAVKCLSKCMDKMTHVKRFITRGWHGGNLFDDYRPSGGLLGYAEFCWADWTVNWMKRQLEWISLTGGKRITEICGQTWEVLAKYYPEDIKLFRSAIEKGILEPVGGLYSYAYLLNLGTESNIRQFSYGLEAIKNSLGAKIETYHVAGDHYAFHPQLPQILNGFGYKYAVLRSGNPGWIRGVHAEKIYWRGLDGSLIEALPTYSEVRGERPQRWWNPKRIADADKAGYKTIFMGGAIDATMTWPFAEKEHTIINSIAPIIGRMATFKEYFESTPKPTETIYFDVDDLYGKPDFWAGFGTTKIFHRLYRNAETRLLAAERFEAISYLLGGPSLTNDLKEAWKKVLIAQDHFLGGGCGPWEGQHTGSFYLGRIPNYPGPKMLPSVDEKTTQLFKDAYETANNVLEKTIKYIV